MKDSRLGDKMPDRKAVKWGDMRPSAPQMSEEWVDMDASTSPTTDKWDDLKPSKGNMSEKWVDIATSGEDNPQWNEMKHEKRQDPYSMAPSAGDRGEHFKPMKKEKADGGKVERSTQHNEFGSTREI